MSELITADLVDLDLSATTKDAAARSLAERMVAAHRVTDLDGFLADVAAREAQMPTGLDGGIGIPHCRSEHVSAPTLAFGRGAAGIDFGAADGPADLIFLIAAPAGADDDHLTILSGLARRLMDPEFTAALRAGTEPAAAAALIRGEEPAEPAAEQEPSTRSPGGTRARKPRSRPPTPPSVSSPSPPVPPASRTPTWRPSPWQRPDATRASRSRWRPRGRPVSRSWTPR